MVYMARTMLRAAYILILLGIFLGAEVWASDVSVELVNFNSPKPATDPNLITFQEDYITAAEIKAQARSARLKLRSHMAVVYDERDGEILYQQGADRVVPIASISKLMTAMVVIDAGLPLLTPIEITRKDRDRIRYTRSRLKFGHVYRRIDLLAMALLASENRASSALARTYPGGSKAFIKAMNDKAVELGLINTRFQGPAGLHSGNISTAKELIKVVQASSEYPLIKEYSTLSHIEVTEVHSKRRLKYVNTNKLVRGNNWDIQLSKTGFTNDAGNCLVMKTTINDRPIVLVLLNSWGKLSKFGDSNRIKTWLSKVERNAKQRRRDMLAEARAATTL